HLLKGLRQVSDFVMTGDRNLRLEISLLQLLGSQSKTLQRARNLLRHKERNPASKNKHDGTQNNQQLIQRTHEAACLVERLKAIQPDRMISGQFEIGPEITFVFEADLADFPSSGGDVLQRAFEFFPGICGQGTQQHGPVSLKGECRLPK